MKPLLVILSFLFFTAYCFAQDVKLQLVKGKVVSTSGLSCHEEVLCINIRTQTLTLSRKNGTFVIKTNPTDTIIFKAYGYAEKKISLFDTAFRWKNKIIVKVERLLDTNTDEDLATMYSFIVNNLYTRLTRMDTLKRFTAKDTNVGAKSDVMQQIFGFYIDRHFKKMNDCAFYTFIKFMLEKGSKDLLNEDNEELIRDTKRLYTIYKNPHYVEGSGISASKSGSNCGEGFKGHGEGAGIAALILVVYCAVSTIVTGGN